MTQHAVTPKCADMLVELLQQLGCLIEGIPTGVAPTNGFFKARNIVEALPLTTETFCVEVNRLQNAETYAKAGEPGAACFELKLLMRGFAGGAWPRRIQRETRLAAVTPVGI